MLFRSVHTFAEGLWLFNIGLFILFSVLYGARWMLYFDEARVPASTAVRMNNASNRMAK